MITAKVTWHLPKRRGGLCRRPFATTSLSALDTLRDPIVCNMSWYQVYNTTSFSQEVHDVAAGFVEAHYDLHRVGPFVGWEGPGAGWRALQELSDRNKGGVV